MVQYYDDILVPHLLIIIIVYNEWMHLSTGYHQIVRQKYYMANHKKYYTCFILGWVLGEVFFHIIICNSVAVVNFYRDINIRGMKPEAK